MLEASTIRRSVRMGWPYLAMGIVFPLVLSLPLLFAGGSPEIAAFTKLFPLQVPIFAVLGSMGGLMTFVSDRTKGVYEYLLAYRVRPLNLFTNGLVSTATMAAIAAGVSLAAVLTIAVAAGVPVTSDLVNSIGLYAIPMSFAGALFTATVGMIWSSMSNPRTGFNSPVGIAPMIGIVPPVLVLILVEAFPPAAYYYVTVGAALTILAGVAILLFTTPRVLVRERFLSPL
jgi:hypothetical protein